MKMKKIIKTARNLANPFRVSGDGNFRLRDFDCADTLDFTSADKPRAREVLATGIAALADSKRCFTPRSVGRSC
jgi:hypothetical protein